MTIDQHIKTILDLDVEGLEKARRKAVMLKALEEKLEIADLEPARKAGKAIKKHIKRRLAPHSVEFLDDQPGFHMFHSPPRLTVGLRFEVWPRLPGSVGYSIPARPILFGSIGARDADELERLLSALKDAADLLARATQRMPADE